MCCIIQLLDSQRQLNKALGCVVLKTCCYQKTFSTVGTFSDATLMRNEFLIKFECKADPNQNTVQLHVDQEEKLSGAESAVHVLTMVCLLVPGMSDPEKRARAVREKEKGNEVRTVRLTDVCVTGTVWPVPWTLLKAATSQKMLTKYPMGKSPNGGQ